MNRYEQEYTILNIIQRNEDECLAGNDYNGKYFVARITTVPVLFILSALGAFAPLVAMYTQKFKVPSYVFFAIKFFGSGVIIATGFIHLMAEANASLTNTCLGAPFTEYPFTEAIALMALYLIFFFDAVAHKKLVEKAANMSRLENPLQPSDKISISRCSSGSLSVLSAAKNIDKEKHSGNENEENKAHIKSFEKMYQKILNCIVLECGIVLHSIFVGLSLTISGDEFVTLYIAIGFHQFFEGLGLGTRFATTQWPPGKKYVPWLMSLAYSLTTPLAAGIGLIVRGSYPAGSRTALIVTGTFDAACAGILIYNSVAELMAYDLIYSGDFENSSMNQLLLAYFFLALGALAMAIIGKWA